MRGVGEKVEVSPLLQFNFLSLSEGRSGATIVLLSITLDYGASDQFLVKLLFDYRTSPSITVMDHVD